MAVDTFWQAGQHTSNTNKFVTILHLFIFQG